MKKIVGTSKIMQKHSWPHFLFWSPKAVFLLLLLSSSEPTNLGESFRAIFLPHFTILLWKKITKYPLHLNKASDVGEKLIFIL